MWPELIVWLKKWPLKMGLVEGDDLKNILLCRTIDDVIATLEPELRRFHEKAIRKREKKKI
jgi:hypothetical protein